MTMFTLFISLILVIAGAVASYMHTRRYGTKRNVKLLYPLMLISFVVVTLVQKVFPDPSFDWGMLVMVVWVAAIVGSLLTWLRTNRRGLGRRYLGLQATNGHKPA